MKPTLINPVYVCRACEWVYDDEDEAAECCMPGIDERYRCPICSSLSCSEAAAIACCAFDPEAPPPPPSAVELERAGQLRLIE